jgi:hypothetical protein
MLVRICLVLNFDFPRSSIRNQVTLTQQDGYVYQTRGRTQAAERRDGRLEPLLVEASCPLRH